MLKSALVGALLMAVLLPGLALVRDTSGHDWYAAGKVTLAEAAIASRLDRQAQTQYRTKEGETETLTRFRMMFVVEALVARSRIVSTALSHAVLGVASGALLAVFFEILWMRRRVGQGRRAAVRPKPAKAPPSEVWHPANCVEGVLRLRGMKPVQVWVVPPMDNGMPAQVYGTVDERAALPRAPDESVGEAPPVNAPRALPAPAPKGGNVLLSSDGKDHPPDKPGARGQTKLATRRRRNQRKPARAKPGTGKLWF